MSGEHMGDAVGVFIQLIVKIQHCTAGIAKNGIHALLTKDLHKNLRTVQLHGELLLFLFLLHFQQNFPQTRYFSHLHSHLTMVNYTINRADVNRQFVT